MLKTMATIASQLAQNPMATGALLAALAGLLYLLYLWALPKPLPGIPYDPADARSLLGSLPKIVAEMRRDNRIMPWLNTRNAFHNAPLVQVWFGPLQKPTLILSDFQEAQDLLVRRTKEFDRAGQSIASFHAVIWDHHIAMRTADPRFKGNRELVRDLMSPQFLGDVSAAQIYKKTMSLIELWELKRGVLGGRPFEARQDINNAAMDIVNAAAFALPDDMGIVQAELDHYRADPSAAKPMTDEAGGADFQRIPLRHDMAALRAAAAYVAEQVRAPFPRIAYWWRVATDGGKLRGELRAKDEVIRGQIAASVERLGKGDAAQLSATDLLVQREDGVARKEGRAPDYFSTRIMHELYGYVVAGHDTTSAALSWTLKLIADNPDSQNKLRSALHTAFPAALHENRPPTALEISKTPLPYLDAFLEESLRIGAPAPMFAREAIADTLLLGHPIPKGTPIIISGTGPSLLSPACAIDPSLRSESSRTKSWGSAGWADEDIAAFRPERWLKYDGGESGQEERYDSQAGPFLGFSLGNRGCFGRRLAYLELRMVVALLVWHFRFRELGGNFKSYESGESITSYPRVCYVGLERLGEGGK